MADDVTYEANVIFSGVDKLSPTADTIVRNQQRSTSMLTGMWDDANKKIQSYGRSTEQLYDQFRNERDRKDRDAANRAVEREVGLAKKRMDLLKEQAKSGADVNVALARATETYHQKLEAATGGLRQHQQQLNAVTGAVNAFGEGLTRAFSAVAVEEFLRKSYTAFSETEQQMLRVQRVGGGTSDQIRKLQGDLRELGSQTHSTFSQMTQGFTEFMAESGLEEGDAEKAFESIAKAADLAGESQASMAKIGLAAIKDLKVGLEDLPKLMGAFSIAIGDSNKAMGKVLPEMMRDASLAGLKGKDAAEDMASIGKVAEELAVNGTQAWAALHKQMTDTTTVIGPQSLQMFKQGATEQQVFKREVEETREIQRAAGGDNLAYLRMMEDRYGRNRDIIELLTNAANKHTEQLDKQLSKEKELLKSNENLNESRDKFVSKSRVALDGLIDKTEQLMAVIGGIMDQLGATKLLENTLRDLQKLSDILDHLSRWEMNKALEVILGPAPDTIAKQPAGMTQAPGYSLPKSGAFRKPPTGFATGGIVTGPTNAIIGEAGPEAVIPLQGIGGPGGPEAAAADMGPGGTQAEREAAAMWGRLHQEAMATGKHASLSGQLSQAELDKLMGGDGSGGGGGGGGGGSDKGWGPGSGKDGTSSSDGKSGTSGPALGNIGVGTDSSIIQGTYGAPLGGVHGNLPFGINVSPEKFSQITGLPKDFMNVSPADKARAADISRGGGVGLGGEHTGQTPAQAWPEAAASSSSGPVMAGSSGYLKDQRASRIAEINNNPATRKLLGQMLATETYLNGGKGTTATLEALLNRSTMVGNTIQEELNSGFYGPIKSGKAQRTSLSAKEQQYVNDALGNVGGGSDLIKGRTDQGSGNDPNVAGPGRVKVEGTNEVYNYWTGHRKGRDFSHADSQRFAEEQERKIAAAAAAGGGGTSAAPTKVGGVTVTPVVAGGPGTVTAGGTVDTTGVAMMEGDVTPKGVPGGRWNLPAGSREQGTKQAITLTNGKQIIVNAEVAQQFQGFFNDLITAGLRCMTFTAMGRARRMRHNIHVDTLLTGRRVFRVHLAAWFP